VFAINDIARNVAQQISLGTVLTKVAHRLLDQQPGLFARPLRPLQRNEGLLAGNGILAQRLARGRLVAFGIEQIVDNLERQPDIVRIAAQMRAALNS